MLSKAQRWEALPPLITDKVLDQFAVIGTFDDITKKLISRFGPLVTDIEFSIAAKTDAERDILSQMAGRIQAESDDQALRSLMGAAG